jgi:hypothetical protein
MRQQNPLSFFVPLILRVLYSWWSLFRLCRVQRNIDGRISQLLDDLIL